LHPLDENFCCNGCESAYKIINSIGLGNYYKFRQINDETNKIKPEIDEILDLEEFSTQENDKSFSITMSVVGLHCAACVWLIENILKKQPQVLSARINLSKKCLVLKWCGCKSDINSIVLQIHKIGYKLFPFDEKILAEEEKKYNDDLLKCLAVAGFGAGNVMMFSIVLWFSNKGNIGVATRDFFHFFSSLIALPVIIYSARPFFSSAFKAIKSRSVNMDLAISIAIFLASFVSLIESFRSAFDVYFDSAVMLVFFLLIGRYLDFKARKKAFDIAKEFSLLFANHARLIQSDGKIKIISTKEIKEGLTLLVAPGDKIPADGIIIDGESEIDNSLITGESLPRKVFLNDEVFTGTINLHNSIKIKIVKKPSNSLLSDIIKITEIAESKKNKYVRIADKLARLYTPLVHTLALITFFLWCFYFKSGFEIALLNATAVLIITCPCALALAVPIIQTITISGLIKKGILVKSGSALEKISNIKTIIFDKTGSLTIGALKLVKIISLNKKISKIEENFFLKLASSVAQYSKHPISQSIFLSYDGEKFSLKVLENKGFGLTSSLDGKQIKLGKKDFCKIVGNLENRDGFVSCFMKFGEDEILFLFQDELKEDAPELISSLKLLGKKIILLSGDTKNAVENAAHKAGIDEFYFEQTPVLKLDFLEKIKAKNEKILMIGDGLNDAPALALADVSISFSKASHISQNIADIIIQKENLLPILELLNTSKHSILLTKQNLMLALVYNLIAVPFAVAGYITPLIAAIAMSSSSLLVLLNSLRNQKKV
jgi:Cu2+-exporting ATPase